MSTVAFIPARGGSKGILKKNIKNIAGKPLIAWSILQALQSKLIDDVFVSTDCEDIAFVAKQYGAKVPFLRPAELSNDTASTESAMLHFCEYLKQNDLNFDNFLLIQATSPVRDFLRFDQAINFFTEGDYDSLVTVSESHRFVWKHPNEPIASYNWMQRPRRQDIQPSEINYVETGSFYITKMSMLMQSGNRLCGKIGMFITPEEEAYEIDTMTDFLVCEAILKDMNKD